MTKRTETAPPTSRRERYRDLTREEIKQLARQQMAEGGTASLSLGAIARAMALTPSALYRYFASRDELITALIVDAYNALADALLAANGSLPAGAYAERLLATSLRYRSWALEHPVDFLLIFGNPIPGYDVPSAETNQAADRVFSAFLSTMQAGADAGVLRPEALHVALGTELCPVQPADGVLHVTEPAVRLSGIAAWTKLHGMVMLELVGHLQFAVADRDRFYRSECVRLLADMGLTPPDTS